MWQAACEPERGTAAQLASFNFVVHILIALISFRDKFARLGVVMFA